MMVEKVATYEREIGGPGTDDSHPLPKSSPFIKSEKEYNGDRVLVALFLTDGPGLLSRVMRVIAAGVRVPSVSKSRVMFSVDGSLSSVLYGTFFMSFVVRPHQHGRDLKLTLAQLHAVRLELEARIRAELKLEGDEAANPCFTRVLKGQSNEIFDGLFFTEYRFGVLHADGQQVNKPRLGQVLSDFARFLALHNTPIAYVYFPDDSDGSHDVDWVRIAIGQMADPLWSQDIDNGAIAIAKKHSTVLRKYDPNGQLPSMSERFGTIAEADTAAAGVPFEDPAEVDVVFSTSLARPGLVADLVDGGIAQKLLSGSMTVVAGHTVSCWVVAKSDGNALLKQTQKVTGPGSQPLSRPVRKTVSTASTELTADYGTFWLAWQCADSPGVFAAVVDELCTQVDALAPTGDRPALDFRYSITRVLADGNSCAGKVKFGIRRDLVPAFSRASDEVIKGVRARIPGGAITWQDLRTILMGAVRNEDDWQAMFIAAQARSSISVKVTMAALEPGEEPWASLVLDSGSPIPSWD